MAHGTTNLNTLLEEMKNWDKDKRFMAASDLTQDIVNNNVNLDVSMQKRVCQAFLDQLQDASIDVQGNAVKCLAKMVYRFQEAQVGEVVAKLSQMVLDGKDEVRDIYATCLKGLIAELPGQLSTTLCNNCVKHMLAGLGANMAAQVQEECCDVLADILKRFGDNRSWWGMQEPLTNGLIRVLKAAGSRASLRKKAIACIGALSAVLPDQNLSQLVKGLLADVRSTRNKVDKQTFIQCIGTVGRSTGPRIGPHLAEITPLFLEICKNSTASSGDVEMEGADAEHELVDNCLSAMEAFVLRCTGQMTDHLDPLSTLVLQLIAYDPNYYATEDGDEEMGEEEDNEFDDDGFVDEEDDDSSWKVRRAALKVVAAIVKAFPDKSREVYGAFTHPLVERFKEREENVKLDVFNTFAELVKSAVIFTDGTTADAKDEDAPAAGVSRQTSSSAAASIGQRRTFRRRQSADGLVVMIPQVVTALLRQLKSKQVKTRQGALALLKTISHALPQQVEAVVPKLSEELTKCLKDSASPVRLDALTIYYQQLVSYKEAAVYQALAANVVPLFLKLVDDSYYKISAQALRVLGAYVVTLRPDLHAPLAGNLERLLLPAVDTVRGKLTASEVDQEVKEAALTAFGQLSAVVGDLPAFQPGLKACLVPFVDRLRNEVTRRTSMLALKMLCVSPVRVELGEALPQITSHLGSLLNHQSRAFRQMCLDVLVALVAKYGQQVPTDILTQILNECAPYVVDSDLHIADLCITLIGTALSAVPATAPTVASRCLGNILNVTRSPVLQGHAQQSILEFFALIARYPQQFPFAAIVQELSNVVFLSAGASQHAARQVLATLAKALAVLVARCGDGSLQAKSVQTFMQATAQGQDKALAGAVLQQVELYVLALGETGKFIDLSKHHGACEGLLAALRSPHEEVRSAAAVALGYATVGAMSTFLPVLVGQIQASGGQAGAGQAAGQKTHYLLLTSLREVIAQHQGGATAAGKLSDLLRPHVPKVLPILQQYADSAEESDRTVVAECLGQLLVLAPQDVLPSLAPLFSSASPKTRSTAVSSVRFAASKQCEVAVLEPLKAAFLHAVQDQDMGVRRSFLQSVNVVCMTGTCSSWLRDASAELLERLWSDTQVKQELIREVDLGPFKHKVDDGLPLRKAAYTAVASLLSAYPERVATSRVMDFIVNGLQDSDDIQLLCCQILSDLAALSRTSVLQKLTAVVDPIDKALSKALKQLAAKQEVDRVTDQLRLFARTLRNVNAVTESDMCTPYQDMMARYVRDPTFAAFWEQYGQKE